jgi:hypothetical protein
MESEMEKRDFARYAVETPVTLQYSGGRKKVDPIYSRSLNISAGGILIDTHPLPEGKKIKLEIELPMEVSKLLGSGRAILIKATGLVLRSGPDGAAVKFDESFDVFVAGGPGETAVTSKG